jgi:hypothetical protein
VTVVEFNDFFGFEFILKKRISLFFQVDDLVLSSWIDPSAVTNEKEEGARGLVLFNKQTVKDFERLFMMNGKWKPKRFGWKLPTAGKVGKYFDSFPIYFLFTRLVCVWANPSEKIEWTSNNRWINHGGIIYTFKRQFLRLKYGGGILFRLFCLSRNGHQSRVTPTPHAK